MKKLILILFLLAIVCFTIGFSSCIVTEYTTENSNNIYSPSYVHPSVQAIRDQDAIYRVNAIKYAEQHYSGKNPTSNSSNAKSVVGTSNDPFISVRNINLTPTNVSRTQYYNVTIK